MSERNELENGMAKEYTLAGRAVFTLENTATGNHYSYKVTASKNGEVFFVRALHVQHGHEDDRRGAFIGTIFADGERFVYSRYKAGLDKLSTPVQVFEWAWNRIKLGKLEAPIAFYHEGRCGACGRELTDPESISRGIGPICAGKR